MPDQSETNLETMSDKPKMGNPNWIAGMASPNPQGRPLGIKSLTHALEGIIDKEVMAKKLWRLASDDKAPALQLEAIKYIYARIEGSPIQAMRHSSDGSIGPMIFIHPGKVADPTDTIVDAVDVDVLAIPDEN